MTPAPPPGEGGSLTVHQLLQAFGPDYLQQFGKTMPGRQREVLERILRCRTPALGGQLFACEPCGRYAWRYHSCNDRHCPLCGQTDGDEWLARQQARLLLPVPYFLVTFTVPEALRTWIRSHPQRGYDLLFAASAQALQDLAQNPKWLGAQLGMLGVLHTWSRQLLYHPHIHYLIPGGGLSLDGRTWVPLPQADYLFNAFALADRCRNLFAAQLQAQAPDEYAQLPRKIWKQRWVTDVRAVGSGEAALRYLSRYIFKTATGNRTIERLPNGRIRWPYRDYETRQAAQVDLTPTEFIRRYLQHVLPKGYHRVRCFGWLHPAARVRANRVRALLGTAPVLTPAEQAAWQPPPGDEEFLEAPEPANPASAAAPAASHSAPCCPGCQRTMVLVAAWKPGRAPPVLPRKIPP